VKRSKGFNNILLLSVSICVNLWPNRPVLGDASVTPSTDPAFDAAAQALDKAKQEVQSLKDQWDKARLETTLYDQRAKRAFQKWTKAAKKTKDNALAQKKRADLELRLAVEKRKLAYNEWQGAQLRELARESELKALDQDRDTRAVREKVKELESKISPRSSAVSGQ
jgi:hypothetical protein